VGDAAPALIELGSDPATLTEQREVAGFRSVWDAAEVQNSPSLAFLHPQTPEAAKEPVAP
jgi:hypothetical protein